MGEEHERDESAHLVVVRHQALEHEPDRLLGQGEALDLGARARRVALVEDQVEDVED
jgi:hypothetical protein